jgi:hypothetical protein
MACDMTTGAEEEFRAEVERMRGQLAGGDPAFGLRAVKHYILRGHEVVLADLAEWAVWMERRRWPASRVAETTLDTGPPGWTATRVSTIFLGVDHNFGFDSDARPVLFETMTFGGPLPLEQERCCTWDEAEAQHARKVERVKNLLRLL